MDLLPRAGLARSSCARGLEDDVHRAAGRELGRLGQRPGRRRARWVADDLLCGDALADEVVADALGALPRQGEPGLLRAMPRGLCGDAGRAVGGLEEVGHPTQLVAPGGEQLGLSLLEQLTARKRDDRSLREVADHRLAGQEVPALGET